MFDSTGHLCRIHVLEPWFIDVVLADLAPFLTTKSLGLIGKSGTSKTPVMETMSCMWSRHCLRARTRGIRHHRHTAGCREAPGRGRLLLAADGWRWSTKENSSALTTGQTHLQNVWPF